MATQRICAIGVCLAGFFVGLGPAQANTPLRYANITSIQNQVKMLPQNRQARTAQVSDFIGWGDGIATARSSRADLRFNDGSRVRFGQQVVFRFEPGTRRVKLSNGTVLLMIPPRQGQTMIRTPNAVTGIQGSALFVRYDSEKDQTIVGALTDSGIQVSRADGSGTQTLHAGQIAVITGMQVQPVEDFDLRSFYQTSALAKDFQLDQPNVNDGDGAIAQVRAETLAGLASQPTLTPAEAIVSSPGGSGLGNLGQMVPDRSVTPIFSGSERSQPIADVTSGSPLAPTTPSVSAGTSRSSTQLNTSTQADLSNQITSSQAVDPSNQPDPSNQSNLPNPSNPSNQPNLPNQPNPLDQLNPSKQPNLPNQPNPSDQINPANQPNLPNKPNPLDQPNLPNKPDPSNQLTPDAIPALPLTTADPSLLQIVNQPLPETIPAINTPPAPVEPIVAPVLNQ
jgi:FecR protein